MNGWIKLHRKILDNEVFRFDPTAWRLFEILLLLSNASGVWKGGLYQLQVYMGGEKPMAKTTIFYALRRLEKSKMIERTSNSKFTVYTICKWSEYQSAKQPVIESATNHRRSEGDTLIRIKNKEREKEIQDIYDLFISSFKRNPNNYKLTPARISKIKARLNDAGKEMLSSAIVRTSQNSFYLGDNARNWKADLDFIIRSYEQVEKLAQLSSDRNITIKESTEEWIPV